MSQANILMWVYCGAIMGATGGPQ